MEGVHAFADNAAAASLIRWWADAGVDTLVEDAPRNWLAASNPPPLAGGGRLPSSQGEELQPTPSTRAPFAPAGARSSLREGERVLPSTLPDLLAWMRDGDDVPEAPWRSRRILPSGDPSSPLMILTDMPEPADAAAGMLLSGEIGALFDRMLKAIGFERASIWLAPFATVRPVGGRMPADALPRLIALARHQIGLVAPKRLLIMGDGPTRALLGDTVAALRGQAHRLDLGEAVIETHTTFHPRLLHERPAAKAQAWKDLQLLMQGL